MVIVRLCDEMKDKIFRLLELQFQPSDSKIEKLISIDRIDSREIMARKELDMIIKSRSK